MLMVVDHETFYGSLSKGLQQRGESGTYRNTLGFVIKNRRVIENACGNMGVPSAEIPRYIKGLENWIRGEIRVSDSRTNIAPVRQPSYKSPASRRNIVDRF